MTRAKYRPFAPWNWPCLSGDSVPTWTHPIMRGMVRWVFRTVLPVAVSIMTYVLFMFCLSLSPGVIAFDWGLSPLYCRSRGRAGEGWDG